MMKLAHTHTSYLLKILTPLIILAGTIFSFAAYAETIDPVSFYDKPLYTFRGKTPHISMPISNDYSVSVAAWNMPRVSYANLPLSVKSSLTNKEIYVTQAAPANPLLNEYLIPANPKTKFVEYTTSNNSSINLGYFNTLLCYKYNTGGYFETISGSNSSNCSGNFSGNYLNWLTMSSLDLIRYSLTGGSRYLDLPTQTILKRARVAEHDEIMVTDLDKDTVDRGKDFRSTLVPTKYTTVSNVVPSGHTFAQNCGTDIYFSDDVSLLYPKEKTGVLNKLDAKGNVIPKYSCQDLSNNSSLKKYSVRVAVCTAEDASLRPDYCQLYPNGSYKPIGTLQKNSVSTRFSLLSYLSITPKLIQIINNNGENPDHDASTYTPDNFYRYKVWSEEVYLKAWGGVLRTPARFIGENQYDVSLNSSTNPQAEWNAQTGEFIMDANHTKVSGVITPTPNPILFDLAYTNTVKGDETVPNGTSMINYINEFGYYDRYSSQNHWGELIGETLRYLGNQEGATDQQDRDDPTSTPVHAMTWYHEIDDSGHSGLKQKSLSDYTKAIMSLTDVFPIIKFWPGTTSKTYRALRSTCEQNNSYILATANTNNWRQKYETNASGWHTTALGGAILPGHIRIGDGDSDFFYAENFASTKSVRTILGEIDPKLRHIASAFDNTVERVFEHTTPATPATTTTYGQDRYITSALLAGANLYGIIYRYKSGLTMNKVRSTIIDVGEPELDSKGVYAANPEVDCSLYSAGVYGSHSQNEITQLLQSKVSYAGNSTLCKSWVAARANNDVVAMDSLLPSKGYFYPSNPNKIVDGIKRAFRLPVVANGNTAAGVTQNLEWQEDGSRRVYLFKNNLFTKTDDLDTSISTQLKKYQLYLDATDGDTVKSKETSITQAWEASLASSLRSNTTRNIILGGGFKKDANGVDTLERNSPVKFTYTDIKANSSDTQALSSLKTGLAEKVTPSLDIETLLSKRIDYFRGAQTDEQTAAENKLFRKRNFVLGSSANSYLEYLTGQMENGNEMIYLTSNDGMLHGIEADSGKENFAYIPRAILPKLYEYGEQGYVDKPLIEGYPNAKVIVPNTQKTYSNPFTVVTSGFGSGAKGVFAINTSSPHNTGRSVSASDVLFEFTDKDDLDMGYFVGQPAFVVLYTGQYTKNGKKINRYETFVAVTSGYNNVNSQTEYDTSGQPKNKMYLFLLKTDKLYETPWKQGTCDTCNYRKIEITDSSMTNVTNNGLTAPRIIGYGTRTVYFYMGDLQGNLWRYSYDEASFKDTDNSGNPNGDLKIKKVFASSEQTTLRPIAARPTIALSQNGGFMVTFGTGRYFGLNDLGASKLTQQSLVTVHDKLGTATLSLSDLNTRKMDTNLVVKSGTDTPTKSNNGWYIDFVNSNVSGERSVFSPRIKDNTVIFTTQILGKFDDDICGANGGTLSYVDLYTGLGGFQSFSNKLIGEVLVTPAMKIKGGFDNRQASGQGGSLGSTTSVIVGGGTDSSTPEASPIAIPVTSYSVKGRLSWREIVKSGL